MQTFLPYPDFERSLACLDYRRLGKQRVEAMQLLRAIALGKGGWTNHPATRMWRDYVPSLKLYHDLAIKEWKGRGYNNSMKLLRPRGNIVMPHWFGDKAFHRSHQSNLVRKLPEHYRRYFPKVPDNLPYIWPV